MTTLLGFTGSLRRKSFNSSVLRAVAGLLPDNTSLVEFDVASIPFYNEDLEGDALPEVIVALRSAVAGADGLVFCSPEYNGSMSAVSKNIIDWLSRPKGVGAIMGKRTLLLSATPGPSGGKRVLEQQRTLLEALNNTVVGVHAIANVNDRLHVNSDSVEIVDDELRAAIRESLTHF